MDLRLKYDSNESEPERRVAAAFGISEKAIHAHVVQASDTLGVSSTFRPGIRVGWMDLV